MDLHASRYLAIDALRQEEEMAQEQQDYLLLLRVYWHFPEMSEDELVYLLKRLKFIAKSGRFSPVVLEYLKVTVRTQLKSLRKLR